jgi:hypothetical protein
MVQRSNWPGLRAFPRYTKFAGDSGNHVATSLYIIYKDGVRACGFGTRVVKKLEWIEMAQLATILFPVRKERARKKKEKYTVGSDWVTC